MNIRSLQLTVATAALLILPRAAGAQDFQWRGTIALLKRY